MKFASILSAKLLIVLFLGIAATSAFYGKKIYQGLPSLKREADRAMNDAKALEKAARGVQAKLVPDKGHVVLSQALAETLLTVMNNRVRYNIQIGTITPHKNAGNANVTDIESLSEPIKGTSIPSVRFNLRGTYGDYARLKGYLAELRKLPTSIAYLKIDEKSFELGLRVYGNT